jgi:D-alanyl-D-alanine carboxypeptidase
MALVFWVLLALFAAPAGAQPPLRPDAVALWTLPKACWPSDSLRGRDTVYRYVPCNSLAVLDSAFRARVECTLARQRAGGWSPRVYETLRSDALQYRYYQRGRTIPGLRVTNAKSARTSAHGTGFAVDIIDTKRLWNAPARYWWWQGYHAEQCGLEAGYYWKRFPDAPHLQSRTWRKPQ